MKKRKVKKVSRKKDSKRNLWIVSIIIVALGIGIFVFNIQDYVVKENFSVSTLLLKLNIPNGGQSLEKVIITNSDGERDFKLSLENLNDIAYLDEEEFTLGSGERKEIGIYFNDRKKEVDVYIGQLVIDSSSMKKIPIIVSVEDANPYFAIIQNPIPNYLNVYPGGKIGMEVKFSNLRDFNLHDVYVDYLVKNLDGETILSKRDTIAVKDSLTHTSPILNVPKNVKPGHYVFVTLMQDGTESSASYFFEIRKEGFSADIGKLNDYIILIILGVIVLMLGYFFYFVKTKTSLFQLQKFQKKELARNLALIKKYERELKKIENRTTRERRLRDLGKKSKIVIRNIKVKQRSQREEIKKLKKVGKKELIKAKLDRWERQGYEMTELKSHIKISKKGMKEQMGDWKKQGYNVDMFKS
jgi:hypothetical protein